MFVFIDCLCCLTTVQATELPRPRQSSNAECESLVCRLFATLDPALRRVHLPSGREAILSDTVGFISDLPHQLVNAFRVRHPVLVLMCHASYFSTDLSHGLLQHWSPALVCHTHSQHRSSLEPGFTSPGTLCLSSQICHTSLSMPSGHVVLFG